MKRTILFVSHDLEEAVKIGNHIAIMEGGRIVQHGPPEDIVLNPANGYVADFVAHLNPLPVMRVRDAMRAQTDDENAGVQVDADSQVRDLIPLFAKHRNQTLQVVENNQPVGTIGAEDVLSRLSKK